MLNICFLKFIIFYRINNSVNDFDENGNCGLVETCEHFFGSKPNNIENKNIHILGCGSKYGNNCDTYHLLYF